MKRSCCDSLCSILFLDGKGERFWKGAAPSLPKSYLAAFNGREIASCWGPCGAAAFHKEQVIAADVQSDPRWDGCRDFVLSHGLRACWSTPIFSSDARVLGTLAILSREPCKPTPHDRRIIKQFTHLASIAIERNRSEEALRRSEAYLAEAQKLSHTGSFGWNLATGELVWSAETFRMLGYERTSTPTLEMVLNRVHPEDRPLVHQMLEAAAREGRDLNLEHRLLMPDGSLKHLHVLGQASGDVSGKVEFVGAVMDVSERKRATALVAAEKRILEMIAGGVALPSILDAICRFGEEMVGEALVSILLVSADRKNLRHGAAPSLPQDFIEAIGGGLIGPCAGSCGTAAYRSAPVIVSDIATDPLWVQCRLLALKNGLRACWSTPIFSASREVVGTFALYAREPSEPTVEQRNVIEQMTRLAAVAIERQRAGEALRRSESRFEGILQIAEDAIISVDSNRRILLFNQGAEKVFGFAATEVIGQPLELLMPHRFADRHREHFEEFAKSPEISRTMAQRREVFGRRKDGREFPAEASISKLELGEEVVFTVILRDITARKRAEENLRQSEADLREAQRLTHVGSWRQDLKSGKVKVSPEMHRIFQIQPYEDASDPQLYRGRVHPEDRQRVRELFDRCKKEKIAGQAEFRIVLPDGTIRHHHSVGRPILNQAGDAVEFVGTAMDVTERREAQEALHASEHLARGQVAALTSALEALARESDPDRLLEHVLRTIVEQTQAQSIAAWNRSEDGVTFDLIAVIENDQYQTRDEASHPARRLSMLPEHHPVWREVLQTGQHGLMDDIDKESARMCVGSRDWHRMVEDVDPDPAFTILMNHLREMGVRGVLFVPILIAGNVAGMLAIRFQEKRHFSPRGNRLDTGTGASGDAGASVGASVAAKPASRCDGGTQSHGPGHSRHTRAGIHGRDRAVGSGWRSDVPGPDSQGRRVSRSRWCPSS